MLVSRLDSFCLGPNPSKEGVHSSHYNIHIHTDTPSHVHTICRVGSGCGGCVVGTSLCPYHWSSGSWMVGDLWSWREASVMRWGVSCSSRGVTSFFMGGRRVWALGPSCCVLLLWGGPSAGDVAHSGMLCASDSLVSVWTVALLFSLPLGPCPQLAGERGPFGISSVLWVHLWGSGQFGWQCLVEPQGPTKQRPAWWLQGACCPLSLCGPVLAGLLLCSPGGHVRDCP